ncbi:hypothetical protein JCM16303_005965 [Sporobolomyces ruberrimus]
MAVPKPENLERIMAPVLVGSVFSCISAGLVLSLAATYYTRFNSDAIWVKLSVFFLMAIGTAGSGIDVSWLYNWSVTHFLQPEQLHFTPWEMSAFHFLNGLVVLIVQHFYLFRCWVASGRSNIFRVLAVSTLSLASFGVSTYLTVLSSRHRGLSSTTELKTLTWAWFAGVLAVDVFICLTMLDHLVFRPRIKPSISTKSLNSNKSTRKTSKGRTISNSTFQSNALPLATQLVVLILFAARSNGLQYLVFAFFAPKVYIISLLATLNSRSPHGNGALDPIESFNLDDFRTRTHNAMHHNHHLETPVRVVVQHEERIDRADDEDAYDEDGDEFTLDGHSSRKGKVMRESFGVVEGDQEERGGKEGTVQAVPNIQEQQQEPVSSPRVTRTSRTIDWSKPSTSAIPYSPPHPSHSRAYSTSASPSTTPKNTSEPTSRPLEEFLADPSSSVPLSVLVRAFKQSLPTLSRSTFDQFFDRLSNSPSSASSYLRDVKALVEKERGWKLKERQLRAVLRASLLREKEHRLKKLQREELNVQGEGKGKGKEVEAPEKTREEERAIWAQRKRQNVSDARFKEYLDLVSNTKNVNKRDHQAVEEVLSHFAACAAIRPISTTRDQDGQAVLAYSLALDYAGKAGEATVVDDDIGEAIRRMFRKGRDEEAMSILRKTADKGRTLTSRAMRDIVRDPYEVEWSAIENKGGRVQPTDTNLLAQFDRPPPPVPSSIDEYSHARQVLDQVCSSTSPAGLDDLLRLRLERVDRLEELERDPRGAFLRWLSGKGTDQKDSVETVMKLWEAGIKKGEDGENVVGMSYRKTLEGLVTRACQLGKVSTNRLEEPVLLSSPLIDYAVKLAIEHFPLQVLIHHSHALLAALTVDSHSPDLACHLFNIVNSPPVDFPFARFQWSATLLTSFTRLFFSSRRYEEDPSLPIRLYLSWNASGLTFPAGLWDPLWRSLGRCGTIDDLERVLRDWEETGRGAAESRIVRQVLQGAINSSNVPRSLELFEFFRSRYAPTSTHSAPAFRRLQLHPLAVSLESYNSLFSLLAHSRTDYRKTLSTLLAALIFDGHSPSTETYNALLASNLLRSTFKISDIDSAGVIYNKLVQAGLHADRDTFGLLMHGFNRMAREGGGRGRQKITPDKVKQRSIGIEASLRTFRASLAPLNEMTLMEERRRKGKYEKEGKAQVQTLARGAPVGEIMQILAEEGRFEDAKQVGEEWWRALVKLEEVVGSKEFWEGRAVKDECAAMRKAGAEVSRVEAEDAGDSRKPPV